MNHILSSNHINVHPFLCEECGTSSCLPIEITIPNIPNYTVKVQAFINWTVQRCILYTKHTFLFNLDISHVLQFDRFDMNVIFECKNNKISIKLYIMI